MRALPLLALLAPLCLPAGAARAQDATTDEPGAESDFDPERGAAIQRRALNSNLHILDLRLALGGHFDVETGLPVRGGFHLAAGFDTLTNEVLGARVRVASFDFGWNQGAGATLFMPTLLRIDHLFFGAEDGGICPAAFLTVWPATHCDPQSGYVGIGGSLLGYLHDTEDSRNVLRIGEIYAALSFLPAFDEAWLERRFPLLVGASLDYAWGNLRGDPAGLRERWIGRALFAIDALVRFAEQRGAFEGRFTYRPSFTDWGGDWGVELSLRLLYTDFHTALRSQGNSYRLVFEVGYAHWSIPERAAGLSIGTGALAWAGARDDGAFFRVGIEPTLFNVP